MVLNRMPNFVGGDSDSGEGFPTEVVRGQADSFGLGIVMVAFLSRLHLDVFHVEPIEQVPSQLPPGSRIVRTGHTILGEHPPGPELWTENDNTGNDQQ